MQYSRMAAAVATLSEFPMPSMGIETAASSPRTTQAHHNNSNADQHQTLKMNAEENKFLSSS